MDSDPELLNTERSVILSRNAFLERRAVNFCNYMSASTFVL